MWQFNGGYEKKLYLIVGQSPRLAYRLVDLTTGQWSAVNGTSLDGNKKGEVNKSWTRVS